MKEIDYSPFFPKQRYLGKEIPKEKWLNADMTDHMKETFDDYFLHSRILFSIPLKDTDLLVIEVHIKKITRRQTDFSNLIHRSMPYPILLIESLNDEWFKVSIAETHENSVNYSREVVDHHFASRWVQFSHFDRLLYDIEKNLKPSLDKDSFLKTADQQLLDFNQEMKMLDYGSADYEYLSAHYMEDHDFPGSYIARFNQIISMYETVDPMDYPYSGYSIFLENLHAISEQLEHELFSPFRFDAEDEVEGDIDEDLSIGNDSSAKWSQRQFLFSESEAMAEELNSLLLALGDYDSSFALERIREINTLLSGLIEEIQQLDFSGIYS